MNDIMVFKYHRGRHPSEVAKCVPVLKCTLNESIHWFLHLQSQSMLLLPGLVCFSSGNFIYCIFLKFYVRQFSI